MFHAMVNNVLGFGKAKLRNTLMTGAMMAGLPTAAFAHHHDFRVDVVVPGPEVVIAPAQPCEAVPQQVWVPAVYQTVTEKVWVEPVTTTQIQRVEVPAEFGYRDVVFRDFFGREHIRREQFEIAPAHCEDRPMQVVVTPGHFEIQNRQQLVCDGHWETCASQPAVIVEPARAHFRFPLPF